jgi:hypothetical protein
VELSLFGPGTGLFGGWLIREVLTDVSSGVRPEVSVPTILGAPTVRVSSHPT